MQNLVNATQLQNQISLDPPSQARIVIPHLRTDSLTFNRTGACVRL